MDINKFLTIIDTLLQGLNPSLFQNIIIGILTIFIPFAIVFLTDILNAKNEKRSEFEKMVLNDNVLEPKKVFFVSIIGIAFFAFFSTDWKPNEEFVNIAPHFLIDNFTWKDIFRAEKIFTIIVAIIIVALLTHPFFKILKYAAGKKQEFEMSYVKKLSFSKLFPWRNKSKGEKMLRAWNSYWAVKSEYAESEFTKIFIMHIDNSIRINNYKHTHALSRIYVTNINLRNNFILSLTILPKILEWSEKFWNLEDYWRMKSDRHHRKNIQDLFLSSLDCKCYFCENFFQTVIRNLLNNRDSAYHFFSTFKDHIDTTSIQNHANIAREEFDSRNNIYVSKLIDSFCTSLFNAAADSSSLFRPWEYSFPNEWKITVSNRNNRIAELIFSEFLHWSLEHIFRSNNIKNFDESLVTMIRVLFPKVHSYLFRDFLMLYTANEVKYALDNEANFYVHNVPSISHIVITPQENESKEEQEKRITSIREAQVTAAINETVQIIYTYFIYWPPLFISDSNLTKECQNWESINDELKLQVKNRIRLKKLSAIKSELESEEIISYCSESTHKENKRKGFIELIDLLIQNIDLHPM